MPWSRVAAIAATMVVVLWASLDGGLGIGTPAPRIVSVALAILALVFGLGAWVMRVGGQPERAPLLAGLSIGAGSYALLRLTLPG